jgi:hypothetical protein
MNVSQQDRPKWKEGILTAKGAARLGVAHLAPCYVAYEPREDETDGAYAGEILYHGIRLGCNMSLESSGILPCDDIADHQDLPGHWESRVLSDCPMSQEKEGPMPRHKTIRACIRLNQDTREYRLALASGFVPVQGADPACQQSTLSSRGEHDERRSLRRLLFPRPSHRRKEPSMFHTKSRTAELDQQVMAELAPQMKRRASARRAVPETQQEVPVWKSTHQPLSRRRISLTLALGLFCGIILLILGTMLVNGVGDILAHWHGGDSGVVTLDADTGHSAGVSHLLAFPSGHGRVVVIECSHDYQSSHSYVMHLGGQNENSHIVGLALHTTDGRRDLIVTLDGGIEVALYDTGDAFSLYSPQ